MAIIEVKLIPIRTTVNVIACTMAIVIVIYSIRNKEVLKEKKCYVVCVCYLSTFSYGFFIRIYLHR